MSSCPKPRQYSQIFYKSVRKLSGQVHEDGLRHTFQSCQKRTKRLEQPLKPANFDICRLFYFPCNKQNFIYTDYPVLQKHNVKEKTVTLQFIGTDAFQSRLLLIHPDKDNRKTFKVQLVGKRKEAAIKPVRSSWSKRNTAFLVMRK